MRALDPQKSSNLRREIERIKTLDLDELALQWRNAMGRRAPKSLPKTLLARVLAYRLQADALGDLDAKLGAILEGYAAREKKSVETAVEGAAAMGGGEGRQSGPRASAPLNIKPGSVLVREWGGRVHRVMAMETGFAWDGKTYRSLSQVARAMTGTRWNGRKFFGVDRKPNGSPPTGKRRIDENARPDGGGGHTAAQSGIDQP